MQSGSVLGKIATTNWLDTGRRAIRGRPGPVGGGMPILEVRLNSTSRPRRIRLDEPAIHIGRAPDNDVVVRDKTVSRRHLEIQYDGTAAHLRDLGSTFGTTVNGDKTEACTLRNGDEIRIGNSVLTFIDRPEEIADSDELVSFENGQLQETVDPSAEAEAHARLARTEELEASLHERDAELAKLRDELASLRREASSQEDRDRRLVVLNEKAERLEALREDLRERAEHAEQERDDVQMRLEQLQEASAHAPDEREMLRLRENLEHARQQLQTVQLQLQHRESMLSEIRDEIGTDPGDQGSELVPAASGFPENASPRSFIPVRNGGTDQAPMLAELIRAKDYGPTRDKADRDYAAWFLAAVLGLVGLGVLVWALLA